MYTFFFLLLLFDCRVEQEILDEEKRWTGNEIRFE